VSLGGGIDLSHITFRDRAGGPPVMSDLSLRIAAANSGQQRVTMDTHVDTRGPRWQKLEVVRHVFTED
jgi:hypothetical protein